MNLRKSNQIDAVRAGRQQWMDEHVAAAARGDEPAASRAQLLVEEYEQFLDALQLHYSDTSSAPRALRSGV